MDPDPDAEMADAAYDMADRFGLTQVLQRAVQTCTDVIEPCEMAGISVARRGRVRTLAASNDLLRIIDDLQFQLREGPCYDALQSDDAVTANDLATDQRWPRWGALASERTGVHASMSHRLFAHGESIGALNMYSTTPAGFAHRDVAQGCVIAAHAAVAVVNTGHVDQLKQVLESRTVIGQATGILMERLHLDADTAFGVLRRISQNNNVKVVTLASDLVQHGRLPGDRPASPD